MAKEELAMAEYTGVQSILNAALGEYHAKGFRLVESDDYTLALSYEGERVALFGVQDALIPSIHEAYRKHLDRITVEAG